MAPANKKTNNKRPQTHFHDRFPRYKEIQLYLRNLSRRFEKYVKVETIGKSYQGRDIDMVIISNFCSKPGENRIGTFVDATIHAREWLSNSTVLYLIDYLVKHRSILKMSDFYIVPCLNPDGYEYTHTQNRLWRKNRNPNFESVEKKQGVDLNRNFPVGYGLKGSSDKPNSFMYRGVGPLSEPESKALARALTKYRDDINLYISLHCHGNVILFPWGYTKADVWDKGDLEECGNAGRCAMSRVSCKNRRFRLGSIASQMYLTSGGTADYAKGCLGIKFCYTIELQRCGKSGFTPSTSRIEEIGYETTIGILAMSKYVHNYYKSKSCRE